MRRFQRTVPCFRCRRSLRPHKPQKSIYFSIFIDENLFRSVISTIAHQFITRKFRNLISDDSDHKRNGSAEINSRLDLYLNLFANCKHIWVVTNVLSVLAFFMAGGRTTAVSANGVGTSQFQFPIINRSTRYCKKWKSETWLPTPSSTAFSLEEDPPKQIMQNSRQIFFMYSSTFLSLRVLYFDPSLFNIRNSMHASGPSNAIPITRNPNHERTVREEMFVHVIVRKHLLCGCWSVLLRWFSAFRGKALLLGLPRVGTQWSVGFEIDRLNRN